MKKFKRLIAICLVVAFMAAFAGCYMVSGQKMKNLKGTYKLTHYTRTPKHERKEGYTQKTTNYLEDADYMYEDYLIITGSGMGYYVHKQVNEPAYVKEVTLRYEYNSEDSSKVDYFIFNDAISVDEDSDIHRLGVAKNNLNYTKAAIDYTELFTKRPMRTEALSVRWEKVSKDTDFEYVEEQLGALIEYEYKAYGVRGIYQANAPWEIDGGAVQESPYQYFYYVVDPAKNAFKVTECYALKETPTEQVVREVSLEKLADDWSSISIDGLTWSLESPYGSNYYREADGLKYTISFTSSDISNSRLQSIIQVWLPVA